LAWLREVKDAASGAVFQRDVSQKINVSRLQPEKQEKIRKQAASRQSRRAFFRAGNCILPPEPTFFTP
jgi:hypothetical protein